MVVTRAEDARRKVTLESALDKDGPAATMLTAVTEDVLALTRAAKPAAGIFTTSAKAVRLANSGNHGFT